MAGDEGGRTRAIRWVALWDFAQQVAEVRLPGRPGAAEPRGAFSPRAGAAPGGQPVAAETLFARCMPRLRMNGIKEPGALVPSFLGRISTCPDDVPGCSWSLWPAVGVLRAPPRAFPPASLLGSSVAQNAGPATSLPSQVVAGWGAVSSKPSPPTPVLIPSLSRISYSDCGGIWWWKNLRRGAR